MTLDETRFATLADATLRRLIEAIDEAGADSLEADLRDGILTIDLESGGHYVVNKHAPNREIWVSSPASGAWHFAFDESGGQWLDTRARGQARPMTLHRLLSAELTAAAHTTIALEDRS
jgi:iron-sulfur cluster assembly protein CyaY